MDFRILYTEPALADLRALMRWSWENHPETTESFGRAIVDHIRLLAAFPYLGVPVSHRKGVRKLLHSPIRIYYRIDEKLRIIGILRLSHSARREPQL